MQGCFIKCEILQSPMILHRFLLFIAIAMNEYITIKSKCLFFKIKVLHMR